MSSRWACCSCPGGSVVSRHRDLSSNAIEENLFDTVVFLASLLAFFLAQHIVQHEQKYDPSLVESLADLVNKLVRL